MSILRLQPHIPLLHYKYCPQCGQKITLKKEERIDRDWCEQCQRFWYYHMPVAAAAIVANDKDQVLLVQRKYEPLAGWWMLPAGFAEVGEHPYQTAVRELKQETHLKAPAASLLGMFVTDDHPHLFSLLHVVVMGKAEGELTISDQVDRARYFSLSELPPLAFRAHQTALQLYLQQLESTSR